MAEHGGDLLRIITASHPPRTFTDVTDLQTAIHTYIDSYDDAPNRLPGPKPRPVLAGIKRKSINNTKH